MTTPDKEREALALGFAPEWADAWGEDEVGVFASIVLGELEQRMRWIPAGSFLMGSPEDEAERFDNEGPQHTVKLSHGFWMADTPCTQALWEGVMGDNPSNFRGPRRPVEQVSWDDVMGFLGRLNDRVPGLDAGLPTEAQWEYACRTTTATYGELDAVAWYSSNSDGETHEVGLKRCNAWGLYDMLGNVWEWCADGLRTYQQSDEVDPTGPSGQGRVIRGGSWGNEPRVVRAAVRFWRRPGRRLGFLGFRLVRGQGLRQDE